MTPEELIHKVAPYCIGKMMANKHKANPFNHNFTYLEVRETQEAAEMLEAMLAYRESPTAENEEAFLLEIADRINFLMFMAGKVLGLDALERGGAMQKDKPRGIRNNNPGNIRENHALDYNWVGEAEVDWDPSFEEFSSMAFGIRAAVKILITYRDKHHLKSPEEVIKRWAPAADNNYTKAYVRHVEKVVPRRFWKMDSKEALTEYARAIFTHENGAQWASEWLPYLRDGVDMAV